MDKSLELNEGKQIIDALTRFKALGGTDSKIISLDKNAEAEKAGLEAYIRNQLFEHAANLVGCWYVVKSEYEPLCNSFASILTRANAIQARRVQQEAALNSSEETTLKPS